MYQAFGRILNLPAVATAKHLISIRSLNTGKIGLNMDRWTSRLLPWEPGVTTNPMQMAQAYGTFKQWWVMNDAHLITKIEKWVDKWS